jgi:hypothetical protein
MPHEKRVRSVHRPADLHPGRVLEVAFGGVVVGIVAAVFATSCGVEDQDQTGLYDEQRQALVSPVTVSFRNGNLPTTAYSGGDDATIKQGSSGTNFGSATTCEADGDDGSGVDKSCLLRWTLTGIPAGSTVQSAIITFRVVDSSGHTYNIHALNRSWTESQTTWVNAATSSPWATAGAMGASDRGALVGTITGSTGTRTATLNADGIALVQSWVNGGTNAGVIVAHTSNTNGLDFASNEATTVANRPMLTVTYLPPDDGGVGGAGGGGAGGTGGAGAGAGGTATGGTGTGGTGTGGTGGQVTTDPNLKIGFIGDTSTGTNFRNVLTLVENEGAAALVVEGDMSYSANPTAWWNDVDAVLGTSFPVFISRGNHDDSSWSGYLPRAIDHLGGATRIAGLNDAHYKTIFRGLVIATISKGDNATHINSLLSGDNHIWKVCNWHQNQAAMQVGGKGDEMGWAVYEACRQQGAIIQTGHEHSYSRTKTLTNMTLQVVDSTCSNPNVLCVGPGRTFANVVGLGGNSVRNQQRCAPFTYPYGCNGEWAFINTSDQTGTTFGAQFIVFNAGGSPKAATGYFKNINGVTRETFSITHD